MSDTILECLVLVMDGNVIADEAKANSVILVYPRIKNPPKVGVQECLNAVKAKFPGKNCVYFNKQVPDLEAQAAKGIQSVPPPAPPQATGESSEPGSAQDAQLPAEAPIEPLVPSEPAPEAAKVVRPDPGEAPVSKKNGKIRR